MRAIVGVIFAVQVGLALPAVAETQADPDRSISDVAIETGFAHASHLAHHMKRVLGVTPKSFLGANR